MTDPGCRSAGCEVLAEYDIGTLIGLDVDGSRELIESTDLRRRRTGAIYRLVRVRAAPKGKNTMALDNVRAEEPYAARSTRMYRVIRDSGWILKLYGICYAAPEVDPCFLDAAAHAAEQAVPKRDEADVFGVGFVIAHQGQQAEWVLVHWWQRGGILGRRLLTRALGSDDSLVEAPAHLLACVWELPVLCFERDAWVQHVLTNPAQPDLDGYLDVALTVREDWRLKLGDRRSAGTAEP